MFSNLGFRLQILGRPRDRVRGHPVDRHDGVLAAVAAHRHEQVPQAARNHLQEGPQQLQAEDQQVRLGQGLRTETLRELFLFGGLSTILAPTIREIFLTNVFLLLFISWRGERLQPNSCQCFI